MKSINEVNEKYPGFKPLATEIFNMLTVKQMEEIHKDKYWLSFAEYMKDPNCIWEFAKKHRKHIIRGYLCIERRSEMEGLSLLKFWSRWVINEQAVFNFFGGGKIIPGEETAAIVSFLVKVIINRFFEGE
jgi:hypothetical protein